MLSVNYVRIRDLYEILTKSGQGMRVERIFHNAYIVNQVYGCNDGCESHQCLYDCYTTQSPTGGGVCVCLSGIGEYKFSYHIHMLESYVEQLN